MTEKSFDGCSRVCRKSGQHTYTWGMCEHAPEPEPRLTVARHVIADDGYPSIAMESITLAELTDRVADAIDDAIISGDDYSPVKAAEAAMTVLRALEGNAPAPSPVSAATEATGGDAPAEAR